MLGLRNLRVQLISFVAAQNSSKIPNGLFNALTTSRWRMITTSMGVSQHSQHCGAQIMFDLSIKDDQFINLAWLGVRSPSPWVAEPTSDLPALAARSSKSSLLTSPNLRSPAVLLACIYIKINVYIYIYLYHYVYIYIIHGKPTTSCIYLSIQLV